MNEKDFFKYQHEGKAHLLAHTDAAYLADTMGLGKTPQLIRAAADLQPDTIAVVCPAIAVPHWEKQWEKWEGVGTPEIVSYSKLGAGYRPKGVGLLIGDEAHFCKTVSAQRTHGFFRWAKKSGTVWLASGSPMPNHPGELYAPLRALWPHLMPFTKAWDFYDHFVKWYPTSYGPKAYGVKNGTELRELLANFMLRRLRGEVDLPPCPVHLQWLASSPSVDASLRPYRDYADVATDAGEVAYTSTLRRLLGVAKAPLVADLIVDELKDQQYDRIVVGYHHIEAGDILAHAFKKAKLNVRRLDGRSTPAQRGEYVEEFQEGGIDVFLAQQTTAGTAIDLFKSQEIALVEPDWTPDGNAQFIKRIHRIGQEYPCRARIFAIPGTVDAGCMQGIHTKMEMKKEVFGG